MNPERTELYSSRQAVLNAIDRLSQNIHKALERAETAEAHEKEWSEAFKDVPGDSPDDKRHMLGGSVVQWGLSRCPDCGREEHWGLKGGRTREDVMEDMRKHVTTCPENPLVKEIEILKKEKADLIRKNQNMSEQLAQLSELAFSERYLDLATTCGATPGESICDVITRAVERLKEWEDAFFGFHRPLRLNTGVTPWETKRGLEIMSNLKHGAQVEAIKEKQEAIRDRGVWMHRYNVKKEAAERLGRDLAEAKRKLREHEEACGKCLFRPRRGQSTDGMLPPPVSGEMPKDPRVVIVASTPGKSSTKVQEEMLGSFKRAAHQTPFMVTVNGKDMDPEARKVIVRILGETLAGQRDINGAVFYGEGAGVTIDLSNRKG